MKELISLLVYLLTCYGLTVIVVYSKIMKPIREIFKERIPKIYQLLTCVMCSSFWIGILNSILLKFSPTIIFIYLFNENNTMESISFLYFIIYLIFDGFLSSGFVWIMNSIQLFFEKKSGEEL